MTTALLFAAYGATLVIVPALAAGYAIGRHDRRRETAADQTAATPPTSTIPTTQAVGRVCMAAPPARHRRAA